MERMREILHTKAGRYGVVIGVIAVLLFIMACMNACRAPQPIVQTVEKERIVKVYERDTTVITEADSASVKALIRCDSLNNALLDELAEKDGKRIDAGVNIKKNDDGSLEIEFNCKEDSLIHEIHMRDSVITELTKQTDIIRERYVPTYYKNVNRGFWVLLVILVIIVGFWAYKLYLKIQSGGLSSIIKI